jgi:hypothetical protein
LKRIIIPVAAIAVLAIGGAWWAVLRISTNPAADVATSGTKAAAKSESASPMTATARDASRPRPVRGLAPASIAMRDEIRDAPDLRAYYDRVKDLPDPTGERSYRLAEAVSECAMFVDKPVEELSRRLAANGAALQNKRRDQVLASLVARCRGFNGMGAGLSDITSQLHKRAEVAGYPAETARSLRFEPAVLDQPKADSVATGLLAANPDPEVLLQVYHYLNARNSGEWLHDNGVDVMAWGFGWGLLQCDYGADCGPQSRPITMICILRGACDVTRMEQVVYIQGGQAALNGAEDLRTQLARRLSNQDWVGMGFIQRSK